MYYDDDPQIPLLSLGKMGLRDSEGNRQEAQSIDEFVRERLAFAPDAQQTSRSKGQKYAWLICCSSIFLLDMDAKQVWASDDQTLMPLLALIMRSHDRCVLDHEFEGDVTHQHKSSVDLSSAHGHVSLVS